MNNRLGTSSQAASELGINLEAFKKRNVRGKLPFDPVMVIGGYYVWDLDQVARHREAGK